MVLVQNPPSALVPFYVLCCLKLFFFFGAVPLIIYDTLCTIFRWNRGYKWFCIAQGTLHRVFAGWTVGGSICVLYLLDGLAGRNTIHVKGREGRAGRFKIVFGKVLPHSLGGGLVLELEWKGLISWICLFDVREEWIRNWFSNLSLGNINVKTCLN